MALVLAGAGAAGAAFGRAIGYLLGAAAGVYAIRRALGRDAVRVSARPAAEVRRPIMGYAWSVAVADVSWTAFTQVDALLIGGLLTTAAVGVFQAPMRLLAFLSYPSTAVAVAVAPRLAGAAPGGRRLPRACRLVVLVQAVLVAPLVVWPQPIVSLVLGSDHHVSVAVLRAIAPYAFLLGLAPLVSTSLNHLGEARRRIPIVVGSLLVNLAIDVALIPRIGVVGGRSDGGDRRRRPGDDLHGGEAARADQQQHARHGGRRAARARADLPPLGVTLVTVHELDAARAALRRARRG